MADAITIKALQDASLDAKSLEEVVNGDAVTTVVSRLGETYPTLSNALNQIDSKLDSADAQIKQGITDLFENGGLPATPFATKALMTASALVDGKYAMVTDDTVNNGLYVKTAGAWVKSEYDPIMLANTYTDNKVKGVTNNFKTKALMTASSLANDSYAMVTEDTEVNNGRYSKVAGTWVKSAYDPTALANTYTTNTINSIASRDSGTELFKWVDSLGNIVAKMEDDAGLYLAGFDGEVQETLIKSKEVGNYLQVSGNIANLSHAFVDSNDNILASIDSEGGLHLVGLTTTVQDAMGKDSGRPPHRDYTSKDLFDSSVDRYVINNIASGVKTAPMPFNLLPQNYTVADSIFNGFALNTPTEFISIDTPYGKNDMVVHPCIVEIKGGLRGYRYIMCITPYTAESHENPVVYGGHSLDAWEMLTGFEQPLARPDEGRFLSDNGFSYDPINGQLICFWRDSLIGGAADSKLWYRATRDGITWSDKALLLPAESNPSDKTISPSLLFDTRDGLWHLWAVQGNGNLRHYTTTHLGGELAVVGQSFHDGLWHCEVKFVGDKYVLLVNVSGASSDYYFSVSSDGNTWVAGSRMFNEQQDHVYKASFIPKISGDSISFDIIYTTNHTTDPSWKRKLMHLSTNTVKTNGE